MVRRQVATLVLVASLVLAGCSGGGPATTTSPEATATTTTATVAETTATPAGTAEPTSSTTTSETTSLSSTTSSAERETVRVTGGELSVDQNEVFARVQRLTGTDVKPRPVEIRNLTERKGYRPGKSPLFRSLGMGNLSLDPTEPGGVTTPSGKVYVYPGDGAPAEVERVLAHEFVHLVQYRASMLPWLNAIDQPRMTHDLLQTRLALIEGGAVYVTQAYAEEYLDGRNPAEQMASRYRNGSPSAKYFYARYHLGHEYVAHQIDSPKELASVYETPPNTTEQVLHDYAPSEEPPADLAVSANASGEWSKTRNNTMGELFTRVVLQTELDARPARNAATGWGNDVLYGFTTGGEDPGFAWTLRMDSTSEADEFAAAVETFAEKRRANSDAGFRVVRVGDETVVLLFGNSGFVENATVSGSSSSVTVSVDE